VATHDYVIANGTGAAVRSDLNDALAAIVSNNSSSTAPATTYAYQWWADTTTGLLKQRNAANSAFVTIGTLASTNLGLASLAGATFTGDVILGTTTALELPDGTTGQRPGSPVAGMIRYNTSLSTFEGYKAGAWGAIGGGATGGAGSTDDVFYENGQTVTANYTITTNKNAVTAGPVSINSGITVTIPSGSSWVVV
jgi:hypothetical protein